VQGFIANKCRFHVEPKMTRCSALSISSAVRSKNIFLSIIGGEVLLGRDGHGLLGSGAVIAPKPQQPLGTEWVVVGSPPRSPETGLRRRSAIFR
jgi:hypothetical protein